MTNLINDLLLKAAQPPSTVIQLPDGIPLRVWLSRDGESLVASTSAPFRWATINIGTRVTTGNDAEIVTILEALVTEWYSSLSPKIQARGSMRGTSDQD